MIKNYQEIDLDAVNQTSRGTMGEHLGIEVTEIGEDFIIGKMPVDNRTRQPYGILHGGASVVLAESLGSLGANLCVDMTKQHCVGLAINSNHIRSVKEGYVYGKATLFHKGRSTQIWQIEIKNEEGKIVNVSRLTMAVKDNV